MARRQEEEVLVKQLTELKVTEEEKACVFKQSSPYPNVEHNANPGSPLQTAKQRRWIPIPEGCWKLSCDASWSEDLQRGGLGWILRDWGGKPIMAGYRSICRRWKISWLETMAITEGLRATSFAISLATQSFAPQIRVESDCLQVVRLINGEDVDGTELDFFIKEVQQLIAMRRIDLTSHIPRAYNQMAHRLAHMACEENESKLWVHSFPSWLLSYNEADVGYFLDNSGGSCPTNVNLLNFLH